MLVYNSMCFYANGFHLQNSLTKRKRRVPSSTTTNTKAMGTSPSILLVQSSAFQLQNNINIRHIFTVYMVSTKTRKKIIATSDALAELAVYRHTCLFISTYVHIHICA